MPTNELWLPVVGWEDCYEVSNHGRVRSLPRIGIRKDGKPLPVPGRHLHLNVNNRTGYLQVALCKDGHQVTDTVHRLVAAAFIGRCPAGMEVCHNDGSRTNNVAENLRYDTRHGNNDDMIKHGTRRFGESHWCKITPERVVRGERRWNSKLTEEKIRQIRKDDRVLREISADYGVSMMVISQIKRGLCWKHVQ